jgi:Polyketide cyclase / dehydrase and lipid transport
MHGEPTHEGKDRVTVLRETVEVGRDPESVFDAIADFSSSAAWDPGVVAARRVRPGSSTPSGVGAVYDLTVTFRGRLSEMRYTTTRCERPSLVVLEGIGPKIVAIDTIAFEPAVRGGTTIRYAADLRLTGIGKVAGPFLIRAFEQMGQEALAGMKEWLDGPVRRAP